MLPRQAHSDLLEIAMDSQRTHLRRATLVCAMVALAATWTVTACGSDQTASSSTSSGRSAAGAPPCPTDPVAVVVSVDQWGDIVSQLGGACATVKTVLASSSVDPHDYEPSPAAAASFTGAALVVGSGARYDAWAAKLAA